MGRGKATARDLDVPAIDPAVRNLIRNLSRANQLWGVSRIPGERLTLDIQVSQATFQNI
ncbi:MAG: hypothetical protein ACE1ZK_02590 [Nitrospirales bacterium]